MNSSTFFDTCKAISAVRTCLRKTVSTDQTCMLQKKRWYTFWWKLIIQDGNAFAVKPRNESSW